MSEAPLVGRDVSLAGAPTPALTERLLAAEAELVELRGLLEQAPALICILMGPEHVFSFANPAYLRLFGGRSLVGKPIRDALPELEDQSFLGLLERVYRTGEPFHGHELLLRYTLPEVAEEQRGYFDFVYKPFLDAAGTIVGILVHAVEVTERVLTRERMRHFERLIDLAGWGVAEGAPDGSRLLTVNEAFAAMHGYTVAELTGADSSLVFAPLERGKKLPDFVGIANERGFNRYESIHLRKDGSTFPCLTEVMAVRDETGELRYRLGNFQDLTEVRRGEAKLQALNDELASQADELRSQQEELQRLYELDRQHLAEVEQQVAIRTEELRSANEELQVQTEELEAHQEELRLAAEQLVVHSETARQQRNFVERLINSLPGAVAYWDRQLVYQMVNPLYARLFNNKPMADYLGRYLFDVFPGTEAQLEAMYRGVLETGEPAKHIAFPFIFEDRGETLTTYWDFELHAMRDADGQIEGVLALAFEVSQRIQLEQEMATQRALTDRIVENAPAGIAYLDGDLIYRRMNLAYAQLIGMEVEQLLDKSIHEVFPGATDQFEALMRGVMETGEPYVTTSFPFKFTLNGVEKQTYWDFTYQPVQDAEGRTGILILEVEVSDRMDKERLQAEQLEQLQQLDRYKDEFLSVISHELRTPLNFIMGFASLLDDEVQGPLNQRQHDAMGKILNGADRMLVLVDDLLDFAKIRSGRLDLAYEPVEVGALVHEVTSLLQSLADRKGLTLAVEAQVEAPVALDGTRVSQVLTNLIGNAIKFTEAGGIHVTAFVRGPSLVLEVRDSGCGIAAADQPKLFSRFQQLDMSATRKAGGTGLGLAIAKAIVEAHGGEIGVVSAPDAGSTFWFTLPLVSGIPAASGGQAG